MSEKNSCSHDQSLQDDFQVLAILYVDTSFIHLVI